MNLDNILINAKDNTEELLFDIKNIPKQIKSILRNLENNNVKIQMEDIKFTSLERCIADLATNLSLSLVLASIIVGSSLIISSQNINQNICQATALDFSVLITFHFMTHGTKK